MSTAVIVGILAGGLFILVAIAVTLQSIEKNKKEKRRVESALNARARNFQYLLDGFPQGFLSRDLQVLVCTCLKDVYTQLVQTDPKNATYQKQLSLNAERLQQFKDKASTSPTVTLSDQTQIKEVQKLLTSLHKFVAKLMEAKQITGQDAKAYSLQIRQLMMQTTISALTQQINDAVSVGKLRLATHHLQTAIDKLTRENTTGQYTGQISIFQQQLAEYQDQASTSENEAKNRRSEADKEWDELNKPDDSWKKKAIYD